MLESDTEKEFKDDLNEILSNLNSKNISQSLFKLGLLYQKCKSDENALIKSAGLLNAAIAESPSNADEIKKELANVCSDILAIAGASDTQVDLLNKASNVKQSVLRMRSETHQSFSKLSEFLENRENGDSPEKEIETIMKIQELQEKITSSYKETMAQIGEICTEILGEPPCNYSFTGVGAISRKEITPYSDVECMILLEDEENYDEHLDYFRRFLLIFWVILLNLQETSIIDLVVPNLKERLKEKCLDGYLPRAGFSFQKILPYLFSSNLLNESKLGTKRKTKASGLIGSVSKMLTDHTIGTETKEMVFRNEFLNQTTFLFGNKGVYEDFEFGLRKICRSQSKAFAAEEIKKQLKTNLQYTLINLKYFSNGENLDLSCFGDYNSTLFISALGRLHNLQETSSFDVIDALAEHKIINEYARHKLKFSSAIAFEIKLKHYLEQQSLSQIDTSGICQMHSKLATSNVIKRYCQISVCLQKFVLLQVEEESQMFFHLSPESINLLICCLLKDESSFTRLLQGFKTFEYSVHDFQSFTFDTFLARLEGAANNSEIKGTDDNASPVDDEKGFELSTSFKEITNHFFLGFLLFDLKRFVDAEEIFSLCENHQKNHCRYYNSLSDDFKAFFSSLLDSRLYRKTALNLENGLENKKIGKDWNDRVAFMFEISSDCLYQMNKPQMSIKQLKQALQTYEDLSANTEKEMKVARTLSIIGRRMFYLERYETALKYYKRALLITKDISPDTEKDVHIAWIYYGSGLCLERMNHEDKALSHYLKALQIYENVTTDSWYDIVMGEASFRIGSCYKKVTQLHQALEFFKRAHQIFLYLHLNDNRLRIVLEEIGSCLLLLNNQEEALNCFNEALRFSKSISKNAEEDEAVAEILENIALVSFKSNEFQKALTFQTEALEIYEKILPNINANPKIAQKYFHFGLAFLALKQFQKALDQFEKSLQIWESISSDVEKDKKVAETLNNIGVCLKNLDQHQNALPYLKRSLCIFQNISSNDGWNISNTLANIGDCLKSVKEFTDALSHYKRAIEIRKEIPNSAETDKFLAISYSAIAFCLLQLVNYDEALKYSKQSLQILQNISSTPEIKKIVAGVLNNLGMCLRGLKRYQEALIYFKESLQVYQTLSTNEEKDEDLANILENTAVCLIQSKEMTNEAEQYQQKALRIYQNLSSSAANDQNIARVQKDIGIFYSNQGNYQQALDYEKRALVIFQRISLDQTKDKNIAAVLRGIGIILRDTNQWQTAIDYHQKALAIFQSATINANEDINIANALGDIGFCLLCQNIFQKALDHAQKALKIYQNISLDVNNDENIAKEFSNIGVCLGNLEQHHDALEYHKKALEIYKNITVNPDSDVDVARALYSVGRELRDLKELEKAFSCSKEALRIYQNASLKNLTAAERLRASIIVELCQKCLQNNTKPKSDVLSTSRFSNRRRYRRCCVYL